MSKIGHSLSSKIPLALKAKQLLNRGNDICRRHTVFLLEFFRFPRLTEAILAALESLRAKKLVEAGLYKEYFTELTDLLRSYIAETQRDRRASCRERV